RWEPSQPLHGPRVLRASDQTALPIDDLHASAIIRSHRVALESDVLPRRRYPCPGEVVRAFEKHLSRRQLNPGPTSLAADDHQLLPIGGEVGPKDPLDGLSRSSPQERNFRENIPCLLGQGKGNTSQGQLIGAGNAKEKRRWGRDRPSVG